MKYIDWDEAYSVGVRGMDEQHKKLFVLINDYYESIAQKSMKDASMKVLLGMFDYAKVHFADEEKLMQQNAFPVYAAHKAQHEAFLKTATEYKKKLDEGKVVLSLEISNFLKDWLVKHIQGEDKQYGLYLNAKGIR